MCLKHNNSVHHDYHDYNHDSQMGGYGVPNPGYGGNGYSGGYGGMSGGGHVENHMSDSAYNGEPVEQNSGDEYSSGYQR